MEIARALSRKSALRFRSWWPMPKVRPTPEEREVLTSIEPDDEPDGAHKTHADDWRRFVIAASSFLLFTMLLLTLLLKPRGPALSHLPHVPIDPAPPAALRAASTWPPPSPSLMPPRPPPSSPSPPSFLPPPLSTTPTNVTWTRIHGKHCRGGGHGADDVATSLQGKVTLKHCQHACLLAAAQCDGVVYREGLPVWGVQLGECWSKVNIQLPLCEDNDVFTVYIRNDRENGQRRRLLAAAR